MEEELEEKILERLVLVQSNIKNNTFGFDTDGSFKLKLELLNNEIEQLKCKIKDDYEQF